MLACMDEGARSEIADNVLDRQFTAEAPTQRWVADFTYIWTAEGWLFVAVVLDLFSRRDVGWSVNAVVAAPGALASLVHGCGGDHRLKPGARSPRPPTGGPGLRILRPAHPGSHPCALQLR